MDLNRVMIIGRLTQDPELRSFDSGRKLAQINVAINRRLGSGSEAKEEVCFVPVVAWDKSAEFLEQYFQKGKAIFVEGRLRLDQWEDDQGKHQRLKVVAERLQFAAPPPGPVERFPEVTASQKNSKKSLRQAVS